MAAEMQKLQLSLMKLMAKAEGAQGEQKRKMCRRSRSCRCPWRARQRSARCQMAQAAPLATSARAAADLEWWPDLEWRPGA